MYDVVRWLERSFHRVKIARYAMPPIAQMSSQRFVIEAEYFYPCCNSTLVATGNNLLDAFRRACKFLWVGRDINEPWWCVKVPSAISWFLRVRKTVSDAEVRFYRYRNRIRCKALFRLAKRQQAIRGVGEGYTAEAAIKTAAWQVMERYGKLRRALAASRKSVGAD